MVYRIFALLITLSIVAGGCSRVFDDFVIPTGHPADPNGRSGAVLAESGTLQPELLTIKPQLGPSSSSQKTAPSSGGHQHKN